MFRNWNSEIVSYELLKIDMKIIKKFFLYSKNYFVKDI